MASNTTKSVLIPKNIYSVDMLNCFVESKYKYAFGRAIYVSKYLDRPRPHISTFRRIVGDQLRDEQRLKEAGLDKNTLIVDYFNSDPTYASVTEASRLFDVSKQYIMESLSLDAQKQEKSAINVEDFQRSSDAANKTEIIDLESDTASNEMLEKMYLDQKSSSKDMSVTTEPFYHSNSITVESDDSEYFISRTVKKRKRKKNTNNMSKKDTSYSKRGRRNNITNSCSTVSPIVCTKRLEDMCIMQRDLRKMQSKDLIAAILEESKPKYPFIRCKCIINHHNKIDYNEMLSKLRKRKNILQFDIVEHIKLNFSNYLTSELDQDSLDITNEIATVDTIKYAPSNNTVNISDSSEDELISDIIKRRKTENHIELEDEDTKSIDLESMRSYLGGNSSDMLIVFKNIYLGSMDMYSVCNNNVEEFRVMELGNEKALIEIQNYNKYNQIMSFVCCCWFKRQSYIQKHYTESSFHRFICRAHECVIRNCKCCCAPPSVPPNQQPENSLNVRTDLLIAPFLPDNNNSLFLRALTFKKPKKKAKPFAPHKITPFQPLKMVTLTYNDHDQAWTEQMEVDMVGEVMYRIVIQRYTLTAAVTRICCDTARLKKLINFHKLSPNTLTYLKKSSPFKSDTFDHCVNNMKYLLRNKNDVLKLEKPLISHTRNHAKAKFVTVKQTKTNETTISTEKDIYHCIEVVLTNFKGINFSMKDDKTVMASISAQVQSQLPYNYINYLKQVLVYLKNIVTPLDLPPQSQINILKNDSGSYVVTTYLNKMMPKLAEPCNNRIIDSNYVEPNTVFPSAHQKAPVRIYSKPSQVSNATNIKSPDIGVEYGRDPSADAITLNIPQAKTSQISQIYNKFSKLMFSYKSSYNTLFQSFVGPEDISICEDTSLPKISSVFTLNPAVMAEKTPVFEDLEIGIPSSTITKLDAERNVQKIPSPLREIPASLLEVPSTLFHEPSSFLEVSPLPEAPHPDASASITEVPSTSPISYKRGTFKKSGKKSFLYQVLTKKGTSK